MITLTKEEAQQVLDALQDVRYKIEFGQMNLSDDTDTAIETLRARLSAPAPEPVAWNCAADLADASICKSWCGNSNCISHIAPSKPESEYESQPEPEPVMLMDAPLLLNGQPLYTAPPQREWQGLTDEEMFNCLAQTDGEAKRLPLGFKWFAEAIEAKLREKNASDL